MAGKLQSYSDTILNLIKTGHYVGLMSTTPAADDSAGGTELSGSGYARQPITFGAIVTDADGHTRNMSNSAVITFGPATADWPNAVAFGVWDAATNGTLKYVGTLTTSKLVQNGDSAQFAVGQFTVKED